MTTIVSLDNPLYQAAMPLLAAIESHGYEAYFVGGCVRDTLLGKPIHDIDLATSATPDEIQGMFPVTFDVGKKHGTIVVVHRKENYEITTFRTEGTYSDKRRPDEVHFVRNLEEDTLRRDFTINALALDRQGRVYDYHHGQADLQAGIIRAVGEAYARFDEDALRMMRALRFASQLGFVIEAQTFAAIQDLASRLSYVSIERIRIELSKLLEGDFLATTYPQLLASGLCPYLLGLDRPDIDQVWADVAATLAPVRAAGLPRDARLTWWALVKAMNLRPAQARDFLRDWKHSNGFIKDVVDLLVLAQDYQAGALDAWRLYQISPAVLAVFNQYAATRGWCGPDDLMAAKAALPIADRSALAIKGQDIMQALGWTRGSARLGQILATLERQVVAGVLANETESLLAQARVLGADDRE